MKVTFAFKEPKFGVKVLPFLQIVKESDQCHKNKATPQAWLISMLKLLAKFVVCVLQVFGYHFCRAAFNVVPFKHVHKLPVFKQSHTG